jgi:trehalose-phosphatase
VPILTDLEENLRAFLSDKPGSAVENNVHCVSVHYRNLADPSHLAAIEAYVDTLLTQSAYQTLEKRLGKKVFELRPKGKWDKGTSVLWLLEHVVPSWIQAQPELAHLNVTVVPVYIGDDVSDEDAFSALNAHYEQAHATSNNSTNSIEIADVKTLDLGSWSRPWSVCVTDQVERRVSTKASYCVSNPSQVRSLLQRIVDSKQQH